MCEDYEKLNKIQLISGGVELIGLGIGGFVLAPYAAPVIGAWATSGASLPIIDSAIQFGLQTAGVASGFFGASDITEGLTDVNPIKDTVYEELFEENADQYYQTTEDVLKIVDGTSILGGLSNPDFYDDQFNNNLKNLPDNVKESYQKHEDANWGNSVRDQTPGTKNGGTFGNRDGKLPTTDSKGNAITYKEYDVNNKTGMYRDSERFVRGSDGSIYYTNDHYDTFQKIK